MKNYYPHLITLLTAPILGFLLLLLVYSIPVGPMRDNVYESLPIIQTENINYNWGGVNLDDARVDNFTNTIMMSHVCFDGDMPLLNKVALVPKYDSKRVNNKIDQLVNDLKGDKKKTINNYNRYWHGWLVFQKPMYYFFNFGQIRQINSVVQLFLLFFVLYTLTIKGSIYLSLSYLTSVMILNIITLGLSLQFSSIYYIMLISTFLIVYFKDKLDNQKNISWAFLIIGIVTSYFDLLTFPLVTWGIPLLTLLYFYKNSTFEDIFKILLASSLSWVIGYGTMWASKWFIACIVLQDWSVIHDAIQQVSLRSNAYDYEGSSDITRVQTIKKVLKSSLKNVKTYICFFPILVLFTKKIQDFVIDRKYLNYWIFNGIISLSPFAWYIAIVDHSYRHPNFATRLLSISVFAGLLILSSFIEKPILGEE